MGQSSSCVTTEQKYEEIVGATDENNGNLDVNLVVEILLKRPENKDSLDNLANTMNLGTQKGRFQILQLIQNHPQLFTCEVRRKYYVLPYFKIKLTYTAVKINKLNICSKYNEPHTQQCETYSVSDERNVCRNIHICEKYLLDECRKEEDCELNHDLTTDHNLELFQAVQINGRNTELMKQLLALNLRRERNKMNSFENC